MHLAVFTTFAASRKEPLADSITRIRGGFLAAGLGEPLVRFACSDAPATPEILAVVAAMGSKRVSSVERVLKRWPRLEKFARQLGALPGTSSSMRLITNATEAGTVEPVDFEILREIARGVPRSFPFHAISIRFSAPGFSDGPGFPASSDRQTLSMLLRAGVDLGAGLPTSPGVSVHDAWWVNGRQRSVSAMRVVEADRGAKKLPPPPPAVAAVFAACGTARKTVQVPLAIAPAAAQTAGVAEQAGSQTGEAIRALARSYSGRIPALLDTLPHDLSQQADDAAPSSAMSPSGPKKPELVRAFAPMGYDCFGASGTFTLRRRTAGNLTVKLSLDVGTWSNSLTAFMQVQGLLEGRAFKATLSLPVAKRAVRGTVHGVEIPAQFPIGGPERWSKIVDNLAFLVGELDKTFVPEVEALSGPSPAWFQPDTA